MKIIDILTRLAGLPLFEGLNTIYTIIKWRRVFKVKVRGGWLHIGRTKTLVDTAERTRMRTAHALRTPPLLTGCRGIMVQL